MRKGIFSIPLLALGCILASSHAAHAQEPQVAPTPSTTPSDEPHEAAAPPVEAAAEAPPQLGDKGTVVLSNAMWLGLSSTTFASGDSRFQLSIAPSADFFVGPHVSLGAEMPFSFASTHHAPPGKDAYDTSRSFFGFAGRVGGHVPISRLVSLWVRVGLGFSSATTTDANGDDSTDTGPLFTADATLLVHPRGHFFVGVGPSYYKELVRQNQRIPDYPNRTTISASLTLGGWL